MLFFSGERQERDIPAPLHRDGYLALMTRAIAGDAAGQYFAPFGDEKPEGLHIFVVDERRFVNAETANFSPDRKTFPFVGPLAVPAPGIVGPCG